MTAVLWPLVALVAIGLAYRFAAAYLDGVGEDSRRRYDAAIADLRDTLATLEHALNEADAVRETDSARIDALTSDVEVLQRKQTAEDATAAIRGVALPKVTFRRG